MPSLHRVRFETRGGRRIEFDLVAIVGIAAVVLVIAMFRGPLEELLKSVKARIDARSTTPGAEPEGLKPAP